MTLYCSLIGLYPFLCISYDYRICLAPPSWFVYLSEYCTVLVYTVLQLLREGLSKMQLKMSVLEAKKNLKKRETPAVS